MAEKKEKPVDWEKLGENAKKVNSDLGQALKELGNQNVTDFFHNVADLFRKKQQPQKSLDDIAKANSELIDKRILERERTTGQKFGAGRFRIVLDGDIFNLITELYFKDPEGQWLEVKGSYASPVSSLTEESRQTLEAQKELTYPIEPPSAD